ncbi:MAG: RNA 2',3'-cyclic phosphodiesterase [Candidatus Aquicultor sp.]|nr:RNA 2',3'-cyclic phosphodiesterase [Candidatus Aquicultor sp.]
MLRIFIGVELPGRLKSELFEVSKQLKATIEGARWVARDNIHLTLKFLGSITEEQLAEIETALRSKAAAFKQFGVECGALGVFPNQKRARVLWVGADRGERELVDLSMLVEDALEPLGFARDDKPFKPHITLARLNPPKPVEHALKTVPEAPHQGQSIPVRGITIYQSHLKPTGVEYTSRAFIQLQE